MTTKKKFLLGFLPIVILGTGIVASAHFADYGNDYSYDYAYQYEYRFNLQNYITPYRRYYQNIDGDVWRSDRVFPERSHILNEIRRRNPVQPYYQPSWGNTVFPPGTPTASSDPLDSYRYPNYSYPY